MTRINVNQIKPASFTSACLLPLALVGCAEQPPRGDAEAPTAEAAISIADAGFQTPESVLYDAEADVYLVSNINGDPLDKDDNGFISRVSPSGTVEELRWIDGSRDDIVLNAPKGMAIKGDTLFVADIDAVRAFDRRTGAPLGSRTIEGALFVNDLSVGPDGTLYATDSGLTAGEQGLTPSGNAAVHRFGADGARAIATGEALHGPNGIIVDAEGPIAVAFGGNEVYRLDASGNPAPIAALPAGALDGIVRLDDGTWLVSSWDAQAVFRVDSQGRSQAVVEGVASPADIGFDTRRDRVLIPLFTENRIEIRQIR